MRPGKTPMEWAHRTLTTRHSLDRCARKMVNSRGTRSMSEILRGRTFGPQRGQCHPYGQNERLCESWGSSYSLDNLEEATPKSLTHMRRSRPRDETHVGCLLPVITGEIAIADDVAQHLDAKPLNLLCCGAHVDVRWNTSV
jgi:hypothetical protein